MGVLGSGEVRPGLLAKGVSMATGPVFPWRFHALAGSQCEKCFGMEARKEQWHNLSTGTDGHRRAHHAVYNARLHKHAADASELRMLKRRVSKQDVSALISVKEAT